MSLDRTFERFMQHFTSAEFMAEVEAAKKEFFERAGIFDEYSPDFEMKMSQFMDWYLFSRPLIKQGVPPVELALDNHGFKISEDELGHLLRLRNQRHSLFQFLKLKGQDVYIRDLFDNQKYVIKGSPITIGFSPEELFESRLIPGSDGFSFGRSFVIHPSSVKSYIESEINKVSLVPPAERKAAQDDLMARLFKMRYKREQYRHVDIHDIYSNEPRLRL